MEMKQLWNKRATAFWLSILPHFKYMAQSGFLLFLLFGTVILSFFYARWLQQLPEGFHGEWIIAVVLIPFLAGSPIRTFLLPADAAYLLPLESKIKAYFQNSLIYSFLIQGAAMCVLFLAAWPLYRRIVGINGNQLYVFLELLILLLTIKLVNLYGSWREKQFNSNRSRISYGGLRWAMTIGLVFLLLWFSLSKIVLILLLVLVTYAVSLRLPPRYTVNWELLIQLEQHALSRWYRFIGWFVDIPEQSTKISRRPLISRLTNGVPFLQSYSYRYLYLKTFIRSDLYGMVGRLTVIGIAVISIVQDSLIKGLAYSLFVYFCGVQLAALKQQHRYVFWMNIYPLPLSQRGDSAVYVVFRLHLIVVMLLFVPICVTYTSLIGLLLLPLGGAILSYLQSFGVLKNKRRAGS